MKNAIKYSVAGIFAFWAFVYLQVDIMPTQKSGETQSIKNVRQWPGEEDISRVVLKMKQLDPNISEFKARKVSYFLLKTTRRHKIDLDTFLAIGFQENSFRYSGISGGDIGMFQINYYWQIIRQNKQDDISIEELDNNWILNMNLGAAHLAACLKEAPRHDNVAKWTCYNSYKNDKAQRELYQQYVSRHLDKIREI